MPEPGALAATTWDVLLDEADWARHLADRTLAGLREQPPTTPPVWFYDARGSELFDQITRLAEYYPTRAERAILTHCADEIAGLCAATSLVELGAGSADKTRILLEALRQRGALASYVPVDCSRPALELAAERLQRETPGLRVHGVVADFTAHLPALPKSPRRMLAFLGSTIGNLTGPERQEFLAAVAGELRAGDTLLLGTDLVKPEWRLRRAYNDAAGVTAAFNLNALLVMNRHLGADFDPDAFAHQAVWDAEQSRIEMRVVATREQTVRFAGLGGHTTYLLAGEWIRTELSAKFTPPQVVAELDSVGLTTAGQWSDPRGDFLLTLARKPEVSVLA